MEQLVARYFVLLPYLLGFVYLMQWRGSRYLTWALILVSLIIIFTNIGLWAKQKFNIITYTVVYVVIVLFYELIAPPTPEIYNPYSELYYYLFLVVGLSFWLIGYKGYDIFSEFNKKVLAVMMIAGLLYGYYRMSIVGSIAAYLEQGADESVATFLYQFVPYFLLWFTAAFFIYKRRMQVAIVLLFVFVIMVSTKRGPLVSMACGFLGIIVLQRKMTPKQLLILILLCIVGYIVLDTLFSSYLQQYIGRWTGASSQSKDFDVTSHRTDIWELFLNHIGNQSIVSTVLGNGFEASHKLMYRWLWGSMGSHNDFIDILYNFGLVGFLPFILLIVSYTRYMFLAIRTNFRYSSMMIYLLACFVVGSMVSSNMTRFATTFFGVLFYYLAGLLTRETKLKHNNVLNNKTTRYNQ